MQTASELFEEVTILYSEISPSFIITDHHNLIKIHIDRLIKDEKNHKQGFDFYIESAFLSIKDVLQKDATKESFKELFRKCQIIAKGNSFKESNIFIDRAILIDATKRAKHEFYSLGNQAEDIMGYTGI